MGSHQDGTDPDDPGRADYRFLLANERTFLAYVRTALSLQVAGLGALQFLTQSHDAVRYALGLCLVAAGSYTGLTGLRRMRRNEQAIRLNRPLPSSPLMPFLTAAIVAVALVSIVVVSLQ